MELDSFSRATRPLLFSHVQPGENRVDYELRRLERMLRPVRLEGPQANILSATAFDLADGEHGRSPIELDIATSDVRRPRRAPASPAWGISLLIAAGTTALISGILLLVAANMLLHPAAWRWGFATTIGGEGVILAGIAIMATRLWRNGRRLNSQLDAVDRRLAEVQSTLLHPAANPTVGSLRSAVGRLDYATATA